MGSRVRAKGSTTGKRPDRAPACGDGETGEKPGWGVEARSSDLDNGKYKSPVEEAVAGVKLEFEGEGQGEKRHLHTLGI